LRLVFRVAARFVFRLCGPTAAPAKKLAEKVAEARSPACPAGSAAKIKSAKIEIHAGVGRASLPSGVPARRQILAVEAVLVVHLPLFRVGEHVIGFLDLLEFFLRGLVTG